MYPAPKHPDVRRLTLLGLAGLFAVLGQLSFESSPPYVVDGVLLYGVAVVLFYLAARSLEPTGDGDVPATPGTATARHPWRIRTFSLAAFLVALFASAFVLRVSNLGSLPPTLSGDEGSYGLEVSRVVAGSLRNPFVTGWSGTPTLAFFFVAPSLWLFGQDTFGLRFPWTVIGALTVVLAFFLAKRFAGILVGALTAIFLMTWGFHIHYSRVGLGNAADGFLATLAILLLYRALDSGAIRTWAAAGGVVGLSLYAYTGARLVPILIALLLLAESLREHRFWKRHRGGLSAMAAVAIVVSAPMLQFAILHSDDFNARINMVGVFQSGWLEREMDILDKGAGTILADQLQRSVLAFNLYPDRSSSYGSTEPLLGFTAGIFFLVGLGYCTLNAFRPRYFPMVAWWWVGLSGTVLTVNAPESQRMNILAVPSAFFIAIAIAKTCRLAASAMRQPQARKWAASCALAVTVLIGAGSSWAYFTSYSGSLVYGNPNAMVATRLARYAQRSLAPGTRMVFFGVPRMSVDFGSIPFLAPHVEGEDVLELLQEPFPAKLGCSEVGSAFVFLPERSNEIRYVEMSFPGGQLTEVPSAISEEPLFILYEVHSPCSPSGAVSQ